MKTLIATAIISLASTSAMAFDSSWDANEYYSGEHSTPLVTIAAGSDANLYSEGNFVNVETEHSSIEGISIGSSLDDANLYTEGNFDV